MDKWNKTQVMKVRLGLRNLENEFYQGRPVIHRDSRIDGGVYLGQGQREAIVVDFRKDHKLMDLYEKVKDKSLKNGVIKKVKMGYSKK